MGIPIVMGNRPRTVSGSRSRSELRVVSNSSAGKLANVAGKRSNRRSAGPWYTRLPNPRVAGRAISASAKRALPAMAALGAAMVVASVIYMAHSFITTSPRFAIAHIEFVGNQHRSAEQLRAELPIADGQNLFTTHLGRAASALRQDPWLASVDVSRELPNTLIVTVTERIAVAVVDLGGFYLADETGTPFKRVDVAIGEGANLPIVTGLGREEFLADGDATASTVRAALAALTAWSTQPEARTPRPAIGEVHVDPRHGLVLHTVDAALSIRLGSKALDAKSDLAARLDQFDRAWAALKPAERSRARVLHLDNDTRPDHVIVALADS